MIYWKDSISPKRHVNVVLLSPRKDSIPNTEGEGGGSNSQMKTGFFE
jgi:hypothetical protein